MKKIIKIVKWTAEILFAAFLLLLLLRLPFYIQNKKTEEQVAKIHSTKLTMDDVTGKYLPPDLGAEADKTVAGIDANNNGIRDDVELAIFKEYPNSAKTRAVLLQYALALQMETTQPFLNEETAGTVANEEDRAIFCSAKIISEHGGEGAVFAAIQKYDSPLSIKQFNTEERKAAHKDFYSKIRTGTTGKSECDIDFSALSN